LEKRSTGRTPAGARVRAKELDLLRRLVDNSPAVIPRDELRLTVWAYQDGVSTRTVDVQMSSLRRKLETIRGGQSICGR
jgi:DNA-binding response OmpR family regulator